jgi:hypothetical protein
MMRGAPQFSLKYFLILGIISVAEPPRHVRSTNHLLSTCTLLAKVGSIFDASQSFRIRSLLGNGS